MRPLTQRWRSIISNLGKWNRPYIIGGGGSFVKMLQYYPVIASMVIPKCYSGHYYRGGNSKYIECREYPCGAARGCKDSEYFKRYADTDIIMSDEFNNCKDITKARGAR
jgi:hypothetical protein